MITPWSVAAGVGVLLLIVGLVVHRLYRLVVKGEDGGGATNRRGSE